MLIRTAASSGLFVKSRPRTRARRIGAAVPDKNRSLLSGTTKSSALERWLAVMADHNFCTRSISRSGLRGNRRFWAELIIVAAISKTIVRQDFFLITSRKRIIAKKLGGLSTPQFQVVTLSYSAIQRRYVVWLPEAATQARWLSTSRF